MAKAEQASVWLARQFLERNPVRWYAEDVFTYDRRAGLYRPTSRQWLAHQVQAFLAESLGVENVTSGGVRAVCDAVRNERFLDEGVHPPFWIDGRREANVIVTRNVTLLLDDIARTGRPRIVPHSPGLFAVCGVPYCYKANADCPNWLRFIGWMVGGSQDEARLLQEFCSWVFVARLLKLEKICWLVGPGANGKSTFLRIARYVIGEQATSAVGMEAFSGGESFRLQPTLYKLANFCNDAAVRRKANVAALNNYVSGDPFTINRKFREQITLEPSTVCFFASNPLPLYDDASDAFWLRLLLIRCRQRLSEAEMDPTLLTKFRAEAPGILNWMLSGIQPLLARGRFAVPESVRQNVAELKAQVNAARQFIREKLETGQEGDFISRDALMGNFNLWADANGFKREDLGVVKDEMLATFNAELRRRRKGPNRERVPCWSGVRWKESERVLCDPDAHTREVEKLREDLEHLTAERNRLRAIIDEMARKQEGQRAAPLIVKASEEDEAEAMGRLFKKLSDEPGLPAGVGG